MAVRAVHEDVKLQGLSSDPKPGGPNGALFHVIDTGELYVCHEGVWTPDRRLQAGLKDVAITGGTISGVTVSGATLDPTNIYGKYETILIPASAMTPTTTNGAAYAETELATNDLMKCFYLFDTTTEEFVTFDIVMPEDWDRLTVKAKFYWAPSDDSGAVTNTVEWEIGAIAYSNGDAMDATQGTAQVISDTLLTSESAVLHVSGATPAITVGGNPLLGDLVTWKISRNVGGTDDYGADARLFACRIQYKAAHAVVAW